MYARNNPINETDPLGLKPEKKSLLEQLMDHLLSKSAPGRGVKATKEFAEKTAKTGKEFRQTQTDFFDERIEHYRKQKYNEGVAEMMATSDWLNRNPNGKGPEGRKYLGETGKNAYEAVRDNIR
jgi:hypothetical protein